MGVGIKVKVAFSHPVNLLETFFCGHFIHLVSFHDTFEFVIFFGVDENGQHVVSVIQNGRGAASYENTSAVLGNILDRMTLCVKCHLAFRVECMSHADGICKRISGEQTANRERLLLILA